VPDGCDGDSDGIVDNHVAGMCSLVCESGELVSIDFDCDGQVDIDLDGIAAATTRALRSARAKRTSSRCRAPRPAISRGTASAAKAVSW
jgi:hypothetical protein